MKPQTYLLYFPKNPENLFKFLESALTWENGKKAKYLLWVDNNDHKVSSEFYTLRKFIKKGLQIEVFINPPVTSEQEVFDFLYSKAAKDTMIVQNDEHLSSIYDLDVPNIVSFGVLNEKT